MSEVSIEGLRQAFLDPGSRIRLNPKEGRLETEEHAELLSLAWEGGFLDGAEVGFNRQSECTGGRPRYGQVHHSREHPRRPRAGCRRSRGTARPTKASSGYVLRNGTKVSLHVRSHRPAVREYRIERTIPNPPLVKDDLGEISNLAPADVLPRIEVFGQHEISELTKSPEKLTRLLDRFVERDDTLARAARSTLRTRAGKGAGGASSRRGLSW